MNIALLLSGGVGTRMNLEIPKQYMKVGNQMIITYSLETLITSPVIDEVWIVAEESWHNAIMGELQQKNIDRSKVKGFVEPGESRQSSIYHGLQDIVDKKSNGVMDIIEEKSYVLIHDAARPLLSMKQIEECVMNVQDHDGVLPVLRMKDTIYYSEDEININKLLERNYLFAGQAPEMFDLYKYYQANLRLLPNQINHINGSTEAARMSDMDVIMIPGDENNFKITTKEDLDRFQWITSMKDNEV